MLIFWVIYFLLICMRIFFLNFGIYHSLFCLAAWLQNDLLFRYFFFTRFVVSFDEKKFLIFTSPNSLVFSCMVCRFWVLRNFFFCRVIKVFSLFLFSESLKNLTSTFNLNNPKIKFYTLTFITLFLCLPRKNPIGPNCHRVS